MFLYTALSRSCSTWIMAVAAAMIQVAKFSVGDLLLCKSDLHGSRVTQSLIGVEGRGPHLITTPVPIPGSSVPPGSLGPMRSVALEELPFPNLFCVLKNWKRQGIHHFWFTSHYQLVKQPINQSLEGPKEPRTLDKE